MDFQVLGPISVRVYGDGLSTKPFPHNTKGHTHEEDHVTALWGRHRLEISAPVLDRAGVQMIGNDGEPIWYRLPDEEIVGNGPDSLIYVPKTHLHDLVALEPGCFHACLYFHIDSSGAMHPTYFGREKATN